MTSRPSAWLALLLTGGALLAGCGSSSSSSTSSTSASTAASPSAETSTSTTPSTGSTGGTSATSAAGVAAIAACKQAIQAQGSLPAGAKGKLEAVCAKAAKGDTAAVKKAAEEVCEEVINRSALPAGPAREQALKACHPK